MQVQDNYLFHYGTPRHSGRYPWGSGENPYQHEKGFNGFVNDLKRSGLTEKEIADGFGMKSTAELRAVMTREGEQFRAAQIAEAHRLIDKGYSQNAAAKRMGIPESTLRNYLKPASEQKANSTRIVADVLKNQVSDKIYLDIGAGVERQLGISKEKLKAGVELLKQEGYKVQYIKVEQATNPDKYTSVKVLVKDDVPYTDIVKNRDLIRSPQGVYFDDDGRTVRGIEKPRSISSDRISIRYAEDGGSKKDGVIEIRPGVEDISLGQNKYAQVRIAVDDTHYLKGMAMYNTNLPKGVDVVFNTNKHSDISKMDVLKKISDDPDNPFGSTIRQYHYEGKDGKEYLSAINIVNDDSDWGKWSKNLASQFLSKQSPMLAERQLNLSVAQKKEEFETIKSLTNPVIKKQLLKDFAEDCDASAVHLKAAALPRQATHVILPLTSLKDSEVYAPNYKNGEEVVLIRYPHGGIFEIPRLKVNNKNKEGVELMGQAQHAIGINSNVAERLSGADFDGDTVVVIPTRGQKIKNSSPLEGLKNFNPSEQYANSPEVTPTSKENGFQKQRQMGNVSNLITDMTIKGATTDEIARAVRHSMVVIDAEKHNLNWKQSEIDNGIKELKEKYQGGKNRGASTIISRASSDARIDQVKDFVYSPRTIDPETGAKIYTETGETYPKKGPVRKDGSYSITETPRQTKTSRMAVTNDATTLMSDNPAPIERKYAAYANEMKSLANEARLEWLATPDIKVNSSAKKTYAKEIETLDSKLHLAALNAPKERQAQLIADTIFQAKKSANPDMDYDEQKKVKAQTITETRRRVGADGKGTRISLNDREWEAIQSGAVSTTKLETIMRYSDLDALKERATPREARGMTPAKVSRARALLNAGYTQADVADLLGVSTSTLNKAINN